MKGCLVVVAVVVTAAALVLGVVVLLERGDSAQREELSEPAVRAEITESFPETRGRVTRQREGFAISYRYEVGAEIFVSATWVADYPSDLVVCVDPDDPARHTVVTRGGATCGDRDLGTDDVRRGERDDEQ